MRFKSLTNDQTVPRYRYFNFYKPHKVDGKGFSSQMPTLKNQIAAHAQKSAKCPLMFGLILVVFRILVKFKNPRWLSFGNDDDIDKRMTP